jgi:hypothetical protein
MSHDETRDELRGEAERHLPPHIAMTEHALAVIDQQLDHGVLRRGGQRP